ncbi:MAG: CidA/LrgA family protein [Cyanobacteriota bacterium]|nr:CidA/LrgA family protein [Cyanobacteriota bacterium]
MNAPQGAAPRLPFLRQVIVLALQFAGLIAIDRVAIGLTPHLPLPLPSNLVGMLLLAVLLPTGLVRESWLGQAAVLFQRHLAFFFVPIAVGLMAYGSLLRQHGLLLLLVSLVSTAAGIAAAGWIGARPALRGRPPAPAP